MAKPGKWFRILVKDPGRRKRLFEAYIHHKNLYNKGNSEVGFLASIVRPQSYMVAWLFLRDLIPSVPLWVVGAALPVFVITKTAVFYGIGWYWDRKELFHYEDNWNNERSYLGRALNEKVCNGEGIHGHE
jgi:hypothetical protein